MATLRSETLEHLGIDATDLDSSGTANLDLLINRSWWDILDRKGIEFKEKDKYTTAFSLTPGVRNYPLNSIIGSDIYDAIQEVALIDPNTGNHIPINVIGVTQFEEQATENTTSNAQPTGYFHNDTSLYFDPVPDLAYQLSVWYKYILTDLSAGNPAIPQAWHSIILFGAVRFGHIRARDYAAAGQMLAFQEQEIAKRASTQAKDDREMKMAAVKVYTNPYSVRH